jgi:hypothetical protein
VTLAASRLLSYHEFMKHGHDNDRGAPRVAEPVQVYLDTADRARLDRLTARLDATKSDVLRRGLEALDALTRPRGRRGAGAPLPTFAGRGLQPGVDLDDTASLLDLMDRDGSDAAR